MRKKLAQHVFRLSTIETISLNLALLAVYVLFGKLGLLFASVNPSATAIWAPTGIALGSLLLFGYRVTPAIYIGAFIVNLTTSGTIETSLAIALGNTLEGIVATFLINKFANGIRAFSSISNIFKFVFFSAVLGTAISATIGTSTLILGGYAVVANFQPIWFTWWLGDMGGAMIVAPLLLVWSQNFKIHFSFKKALYFSFSFLCLLFLTILVFSGIFPYVYFLMPFAIWVALTFEYRGATLSNFVVALIAIYFTLHGIGPFTRFRSTNDALLLLQMFLGVFSITSLAFAAVVSINKKNTQAIQSSDERFKALLENSFDAFVLIDATSRITYASPSVKNVLGYTPKELEGTIGFNLVIPEDRAFTVKELAKLVLKPGGTITIEYRVMRKDKQIIWTQATGTNLLLDPLVNAVVVNFRDITERKSQEEEIKKNEKRFRSLVEKSGQGIALLDKKGKIIYMTTTITELLGYTQEEYEKKGNSLMHPDDRKSVEKKSKEILNHPGASVSLQYRILHKNGTYRWFDVLVTNLLDDEALHAYVVNFRDITDIKNIEEEVREEKIEDEAMLNSIGEGVIATDKDGRIAIANHIACKLTGWTEKELIGQSLVKAVPMTDENGEKIAIKDRPLTKVLMRGKKTANSKSIYYTRKDGTKFPVQLTLTPIILEDEVVGTIEVFRDITEEKQIEKTKNEFVSLASHQLRTPLATINWYVEELLAAKKDLGTKNAHYLDQVYVASHRMVGLINALLNTSRLELGTFAVEPKDIDFVESISQVIKDLTGGVKEKQITLKKDYKKSLPISADPKLLGILIQNLLSNAVKYSKPKGTVTIKLSHNKDGYTFSVKDNGCGIPASQEDKIFSKLFRADNARSLDPDGSGLGLYIVKSILDAVGGKVWFESVENKGTTFFLSLPAAGMKQKKGERQLH